MNQVHEDIQTAIETPPATDFRITARCWSDYVCKHLSEPLVTPGLKLCKALIEFQDAFEECMK